MKNPLAVVAALLVATGGTVTAAHTARSYADTHERSCVSSVLHRNENVRTTRWRPPSDLDDLGPYLDIHWQARAPKYVCLHKRNRQQFSYQLVVKMNPYSTRYLAGAMSRASATMPAKRRTKYPHAYDTPVPWPALSRWVPTSGTNWIAGVDYQKSFHTTRWRRIWLDRANSVAVVEFPGGED